MPSHERLNFPSTISWSAMPLFGEIARDGKADARMQAADQCVDADDFAVNINERAAAVAGVDVRVGLDETLVLHAGGIFVADDVGTVLRADVAKGDAVIQGERRPDGDGKFAHARFVRISQFGHRQILGVNFNDGHIRFSASTPQNLRSGEGAAVFQAHFNFLRILHDMPVGQDVTVRADDDARTLADAAFGTLRCCCCWR